MNTTKLPQLELRIGEIYFNFRGVVLNFLSNEGQHKNSRVADLFRHGYIMQAGGSAWSFFAYLMDFEVVACRSPS